MKITRKGYYTIEYDGILLLSSDGTDLQAASRDSCYEYITEDGRSGTFTILCPNREVEIVVTPTPEPIPQPTPDPTPVPSILRAFPGAEGLAALTRGAAGYSGALSHADVSSLADSGPGTLREALNNRRGGIFITFSVSGHIVLQSDIDISCSYLTIAAQTSGGGICIVGARFNCPANAPEPGYGHIIIRHMRFRLGDLYHPNSTTALETLAVKGGHDIYIDHCSFSWGGDETVSATSYYGTTTARLTFNKCIFSEPLRHPAYVHDGENNHEFAMLLNGTYDVPAQNTSDKIECAFIHSRQRHPQVSGSWFVNMFNCFVHDFDLFRTPGAYVNGGAGQGRQFWNLVGNYIQSGASSNSPIGSNSGIPRTAEMHVGSGAANATPWRAFHTFNNYGQTRQIESDPEWCVGDYNNRRLLPETWRSSELIIPDEGLVGVPITPIFLRDDAATARLQLIEAMADWGATKPFRDSHDTEMVSDVENRISGFLNNVNYPEDWPIYPNPTPLVTTNGISDVWAATNMGSAAWDDIAPSGYRLIEEYVNGL